MTYDLNDLPKRIYDIFDECSPREQTYLKQILHELSVSGKSKTYDDIWLSDYKEIPVSIDTFLEHDYMLGKTNRNGKAVYPYWRKVMKEIFAKDGEYDEVILTGATRIGKSTTAVTGVAYMLYRLMCLRDPQEYFQKKEVSKFSVLFFNVTKDLAKGVAFREFNDTLKVSPWFNEHGTFSKSDINYVYIPEGGKVVIDYGSTASHALGQQVFCLVGSTEIYTEFGVKTLEELSGKVIKVFQWNKDNSSIEPGTGTVVVSAMVDETHKIVLSDGSSIEGTADHSIMMKGGSYRAIGAVKIGDRVAAIGQKDTIGLKIVDKQIIHHDVKVPVYDVINVEPYHNFCVKSRSILIAHNCAMCDEVNFARSGVKDVAKARKDMLDTYNTISTRIRGTFRQDGLVMGKMFAVSSKNSENDFLESYIERQKNSGADTHMYVSDAPQWEVLPASNYSKGRFIIAVGSRHQKGFVVPDNQTDPDSLEDIKTQGFRLMTPPVDYKPEFLADFDIALRDIAGISVPGALSFITQEAITACLTTRRNPFYTDIISTGTKDNLTIESFFHLEAIPPELKRMPLFIHLDLSLNTDKTGIGGTWACGKKDIVGDDGKKISQTYMRHAFNVSIQAPSGDKIPYSKITAFICWLRRQGFNIEAISRDQFQSEYMAQLLEEQGFKVSKLSLDRTPDGYMALRSAILEKRIELLDIQLLQDELIHLQRDSMTGAIDHPAGGCFTGDTLIWLYGLPNPFTIRQLADALPNEARVMTVNEETLEQEPKRILRAFPSKYVDTVIRITLNNFESITCTPEHRFMTSSGVYIKAEEMKPGVRLMGMKDRLVYVENIRRIGLGYAIPVYDLTIEDNPNFLLEAGVFAHNSKDSADCLAGSVWNCLLTNPAVSIAGKSAASAIAAINGARNVNRPGQPMMPGFRDPRVNINNNRYRR